MSNPSVRTIDNGIFISNEIAPRIKNLDKIPSIYVTGKMDKFFDKKLMPVIQTARGCPFTCTYCVEGNNYYLNVVRKSHKSIADELDYIAKRVTDNKQMFIADSNFGMYKADVSSALTNTQEAAEISNTYTMSPYFAILEVSLPSLNAFLKSGTMSIL